MHNWSVDEKFLSQYSQKYKIWQMEQMINFGLAGKKLNRRDLKKHLKKLSVDPLKKKYLQFLLKV